MIMFKETDDIIRLGKWAYDQIPEGIRCGKCPALGKDGPDGFGHVHWYCGLRRALGLLHDKDGPYKGSSCPKKEVV